MSTNKIQSITFHAIVRDTFLQLQEFKKQDDQTAFNDSMEKILPGVKNYVAHWLSHAIKNEKIPSGKYKIDDFVDELYIMAYDHFQAIKSDKDFHIWLFRKTEELLEDTEVKEDFDKLFFKNIDNYTKDEWAEMEEKYSIDGGGDFVMEEELNDLSYHKNDYVLADVFIEDGEKPIIEKLSKELKEQQINRHINFVLHHLPLTEITVFDLAVRQVFKPEEIAKIKQISLTEVEEYLSNVRHSIRVSFKKRYAF